MIRDEDARRSRRFVMLGVIAVVAIGAAVMFVRQQPTQGDFEQVLRQANLANLAQRRASLYRQGRYREEGFHRMAVPKPGEWLFTNAEIGQTAKEFQREGRAKGQPDQLFILQPLGELGAPSKAVLESLRRYVELTFNGRCKIRPPLPLPDAAFSSQRNQYRAEALLAFLGERKPKGALVYAGILDQDLTAAKLNFVFGLGQIYGGVGVYSLKRFDASDPRFLLRSLKLLGHELGHTLGLQHCIYFACLLNGTNSLAESDRAPLHACPVCLEKLSMVRGFDLLERARGLQKFYSHLGLVQESQWVKEQRDRLRRASVTTYWKKDS